MKQSMSQHHLCMMCRLSCSFLSVLLISKHQDALCICPLDLLLLKAFCSQWLATLSKSINAF